MIEFPDAELDYVFRVLLTRPMGEVESIVASMRRQVMRQAAAGAAHPQSEGAAQGQEGAAKRGNGSGGDADSLPLP